MSKVNNQNQLDEYEQERADHSNNHPCCNNTKVNNVYSAHIAV